MALPSLAVAQTTPSRIVVARGRGGKPVPPTTLLPGYDLTVLDTLDGLPSTTVRAISLDADGAMWLGTFGGLCRYDGAEFRSYLSIDTDGLESDRIGSLHLDRSGALWIGTEAGPVSRYRDGEFEVIAPAGTLASVSNIVEGEDGAIWLGGDRLGRWRAGVLDIFDLGGQPLRTFIRDIEEVEGGDIVIASTRGVERLDPRVASVDDFEVVPLGSVDDHMVGGFFRDVNGALWVTGIAWESICFSGDAEAIGGGALGTVYGSLQFDSGARLLSTTAGLMVVGAGTRETQRIVPLTDDLSARALMRTADGTMWIGAERHGLLRCRRREYLYAELGQNIGLNAVVVVPRDGADDLLVTTADYEPLLVQVVGGRRMVGAARKLMIADGRLPELRDGVVGPDGTFWMASSKGLGHLVGDEFQGIPGLERDAQLLAIADDGSLWVSNRTVFREVLTEERRYGRAMPALSFLPRAVVPWPGGFLCISADRLVAFDIARLAATEIARLPGVELRALSVDEDGTLWITSYGNGLYRRTPDGILDQWTSREGLPDMFLGWVGRTAEPEGASGDGRDFLWINCNVGVIRVATASLESVAEGLAGTIETRLVRMSEGNGVTGAALPDGGLALPTIDGLALLRPASLETAEVVPRVMVDEVRADGELLDRNHSAAGAPPRGVVDLEFAYTGILFPTARGVTFQYRLDGHDGDWVDAGSQRVARYTNLSPGEYTFRLRARARDGDWSEPTVAATYEVLPHWYQRRVVQVLCVLGVLFVTVLGLRRRTRAIVRRSHALEQEIERRRAVETDLRTSRAEHLSVLEAAQSGIATIDADGVISYANPSIVEMFGWSREEVVGTHFSILRVATLQNSIVEQFRLPPGESAGRWSTVETKAERADGILLDIELSVSRQSTGGDSYSICIVRDVSERNQMTDKLRRSEERYRTLFRTAPAAIVVWAPDFEVADWNERAEELFGWSRDDAIGSDFTKLFHLDRIRDPMRMAASRVLTDVRNQSIVYETLCQGDDVRLCRWGFTPLVNADGTVRAVISLATDITEEQRVARDLDSLRKRLVRAEETERSRIARELHDDLSQRLAALSLDMQMALDDMENLAENDIKSILGAIQVGLQAVSTDVHALSRQLHPTVLDDLGLSRALRSECTRRSRAQTAAISFVDLTEDLEVPKDVALALFRIAQESMRNALKHSAASEIVVRLSQLRGRLMLEVQDNGVGFDPGGPASDGAGGLGLASMRERARLVNADISIHATDHSGTTVRVEVDVAQASAVEPKGL